MEYAPVHSQGGHWIRPASELPAPENSQTREAAGEHEELPVNALRLAQLIIAARPGQVLNATYRSSDAMPIALLLDGKPGIWRAGPSPWWRAIQDELMKLGAKAQGDKKQKTNLSAIIKKLDAESEALTKRVRDQIDTAARYPKMGANASVLFCEVEQLDADMRYLGVLNGVIDLDTGKLLEGKDAASKFITRQAPTAYRPGARRPEVYRCR